MQKLHAVWFNSKSFSLLLKTLVILKWKDRGSSRSVAEYRSIEQQLLDSSLPFSYIIDYSTQSGQI